MFSGVLVVPIVVQVPLHVHGVRMCFGVCMCVLAFGSSLDGRRAANLHIALVTGYGLLVPTSTGDYKADYKGDKPQTQIESGVSEQGVLHQSDLYGLHVIIV
jgi:hypothetical protein